MTDLVGVQVEANVGTFCGIGCFDQSNGAECAANNKSAIKDEYIDSTQQAACMDLVNAVRYFRGSDIRPFVVVELSNE